MGLTKPRAADTLPAVSEHGRGEGLDKGHNHSPLHLTKSFVSFICTIKYVWGSHLGRGGGEYLKVILKDERVIIMEYFVLIHEISS